MAGTLATGAGAQEGPPSIVVTGNGEVSAPPDMAEIRAGVSTQAGTAAQAMEANSRTMQKVLAAIRESGIVDKDVQTQRVDVSPIYSRPGPERDTPRVTGYRVSNQVRVRVRQLDQLGSVLDKVIAAGANDLGGIFFSVNEPRNVLDQARAMAVADARRKAELYATAAGIRLGRILRIEEAGLRGPEPLRRMAQMEAAAAVPVAPGELDFQAAVTIQFAIE